MAALLRLLLSRFGILLTELLTHFGGLFVRAYLWLKVAKLGIFTIKLGIFFGILTAMINGIKLLGNSLIVSMPPMLADGITRVMPDNFYACVTTILLAKFIVYTFHIKDRVLHMGSDV
ncbi:hypothetical protein [Vreelandella titanicae]|jgi:hypothetical protein|uniref:hypothetical protein n=1 Tax=Vreelandella titanicae TaxID=664683 RepID=UPI000C1039CD|nr:hypothetical protein [Halomonas sp.]MBL1269804.1 DUF5455 family protein [Halomonas sp.]